MSEVRSFPALRDKLDASRQRWVDCDAKIDRFCKVLTLLRDLLDGGLAGPDDQYSVCH